MGVNVGLKFDGLDHSWGDPPSIGAYEYTTKSSQEVSATSPNGGESWQIGNSYNINAIIIRGKFC